MSLYFQFSNIQVSRRYKHFDWLHERLCEKFPCVATPPIPDKQVTGRYEDEFISERMKLLQLWMNRMVRHPVIATSAVLLHFLTCTDEKVGLRLFKTLKPAAHEADPDANSGVFHPPTKRLPVCAQLGDTQCFLSQL
jgi:hypothetical protein